MKPRSLVPPQPFAGVLVRRAALLWLGVRALMTLAVLLGSLYAGSGVPENPLLLAPPAALVVIGAAAAAGWVELRRRNEDLFLANLGLGAGRLLPLLLGPPLLLEAAVTAWALA